MTQLYRLAVRRTNTGRQVVVERSGRLLPIETLLDGVGDKRLEGGLSDLQPLLDDWATWNARIADAASSSAALFETAGEPADGVKFDAPLALPGKIVCVGSNYHDHIAEMAPGADAPPRAANPYCFCKPVNNTVRGSGDPVAVPKRSRMLDWEAELAVVIGTTCADVSVADALGVVAGYMNFNDLSARDWLAARPPVGVDWVQHKAFDGFAPCGPYLVPAQYVPDPQNVPVRLDVNGVTKQDSSTAGMVFSVAEIIAHLSSIMTLFPGDMIATGTPSGVGHGAKPPQYLQAGDLVEVEIGSFGKLVTPII